MATVDSPARLARARAYQSEFAQRVAALPASVDAKKRMPLEGRAANALRELGRFKEAEAMRRRALASLAASGDDANLATYLAALAAGIRRHDTAVEPLDMIPEPEIARICVDREAALTRFERKACARPGHWWQMAGYREIKAQAAAIRASRKRQM